jgi:hypothetical protein
MVEAIKSIKVASAVLSAVLLSGCLTMYDLQRQEPSARYTSQKSILQLTQCITGAIRHIAQPSVEQREGATFITTANRQGYPSAVIALRPAVSGGTNVTVRQAISYSFRPHVEGCL